MHIHFYTNTSHLLNRAIQLITLILLFNIHACECRNKPIEQENKKSVKLPSVITPNKPSLSFKELTLTVDKKVLIGEERTVKVGLDTTKIAISKENEDQATSKRFKLKAFIKLEENTTNHGTISYLKLSDTDENKTEVETYLYIDKLQQNNAVNLLVAVNIQIIPGKGIKTVPMSLALYENDTDLAPIYSTEVYWKLNAHNILLEGLSDLLINDQTSSFSIKNEDTAPLDLKNSTLTIAASQGITFKVNGKVATSISLQDLAQNNTTVLKPGENTPTIELQVSEVYGAQKSDITLEVKKETEVIFTQIIQWEKELITLQLTGLQDITNDETLLFTIENNGNKPINPKDIVLSLVATPGITFKLQDRTATSINLQELLPGNATILNKGTKTIPIKLQVDSNTSLKQAEINLQINKDTAEIDSKKIQWKKEPITLQLIGLHDITDDETLLFTIENSGNKPIHPKDIILSLVATPGTTFKLQDRIATSINLQELLPSSTTNLDKGIKTIPIKLQVDPNTSQRQAQLTLTIKKGTEHLDGQTINWKKHPVSLQFVGLHDINDEETLLFSIENNGNKPVNIKDIILNLSTTPHVIFKLQDKLLSSIRLQELLPDKTTLLTEKSTTIPIKLQVQNTYSHQQVKTTLQIKQVDEIINQQDINWYRKKEGFGLAFADLDKNNIVGDEALTFSISNQKDSVRLDEVLVYLENTTNSIQPTFSLNGIAIPSQGISLAKLFSNIEKPVLGKGSKTSTLTLQCVEPTRIDSTTIRVHLKKGNQICTSSDIHWEKKIVNLNFQNIPNQPLGYHDTLQVKIKNNGTRIQAKDILLFLNRPARSNYDFEVNNQPVNNNNHISLAQLLFNTKDELESGQEITVNITKKEIENSSAITKAELSLQLLSQDGTFQSGQAQVSWKPKIDLNLEILKNDPAREEKFVVHISNQGNDLNGLASKLELSVKKIQGEAFIPGLNEYASYQIRRQDGKHNYLYTLPISQLTANASWDKELYIVPQHTKNLNQTIIYELQLCLDKKPIDKPTRIIWEAKKVDLKIEVDRQTLQGNDKTFLVRVLNQGDSLYEGEGKLALAIKKVKGKGSIPTLEPWRVKQGGYKFVEDSFKLAAGSYWEKILTLDTTNQPVTYELQLYLDETPMCRPLQVTWIPEEKVTWIPEQLGLQLKVVKHTSKWNKQDFTVQVINPTGQPIKPPNGINISVTNIKGKGIIPKLKGFEVNKKDYLFIYPNFEIDANKSWEDHLSIYPLIPLSEQEFIYELQLYANGEKIGEPIQVKWKSKKINLQLQASKKKLEGVNTRFQLSILNQGYLLEEVNEMEDDNGVWMISVEKLKGKKAKIQHSFQGPSKVIFIPHRNPEYIEIDSFLQEEARTYHLNIHHNKESNVKFKFSLVYRYKINEQICEKIIGTPIQVVWENSGSW